MESDPFDELWRGLRGEGTGAAADPRSDPSPSVLRILGAVGAVGLLALGVLLVSAGRSPSARDATLPPPPVDIVDEAAATAVPTTPPVARVWPAEPVEVLGNEVRTAGHRWSVGAPGDLVAVGDWDCNGTATPAVLRPATGAIHLFEAWATTDAPLVATPGPTVPTGADALEAGPCGHTSVRTGDGRTLDVRTDRSER